MRMRRRKGVRPFIAVEAPFRFEFPEDPLPVLGEENPADRHLVDSLHLSEAQEKIGGRQGAIGAVQNVKDGRVRQCFLKTGLPEGCRRIGS